MLLKGCAFSLNVAGREAERHAEEDRQVSQNLFRSSADHARPAAKTQLIRKVIGWVGSILKRAKPASLMFVGPVLFWEHR